jgi:protein-L-isoaspartate O-methyltransferase
VTSIDVDAYLVQAARDRLEGFGRRPRMVVADATGELPEGEYDRMIATVSVRPVPRSWLAALRPGGQIVTTIAQTSLLVSAKLDVHWWRADRSNPIRPALCEPAAAPTTRPGWTRSTPPLGTPMATR